MHRVGGTHASGYRVLSLGGYAGRLALIEYRVGHDASDNGIRGEKVLAVSIRPEEYLLAVRERDSVLSPDSRDDAAVYDLGNGTAVISTTDFFMPIVDDPFTFGRIAATNAISDVYAMGGKPIMAIAIFGWPLDKLPPETGREVVEGGRKACQDAGIPLAGGHSIDAHDRQYGCAEDGCDCETPNYI